MKLKTSKIAPCLWFDGQAEPAARYYCSIFRKSKIQQISRYGEIAGPARGFSPDAVLAVKFELAGQGFTALNGGPQFKFNEAISFQINCETQQEVDHYWNKLSRGGPKEAQMCGWLQDRYGVSWQVVPTVLPVLLSGPDPKKAMAAMGAMMKMKKLDIAKLKKAYSNG